MTFSLIAALAKNRVIGQDGDIPWRIPEDWQHFKRVTMGKPVIMGRRTFESIGQPLPGRTNIVVTRNPEFDVEGVTVTHSLKEAIDKAEVEKADELFVIGGNQLYAEAFGKADRLYLTYVDKEVEGDTFFPEFDKREWRELERHDHYSAKAEVAFSFVTLERA